jgi:hypothetical protein
LANRRTFFLTLASDIPLTAPKFALRFLLARILLAGRLCGAGTSMNRETGERPSYDVVVDITDTEFEIIESGLTRKEAELALAGALQVLQHVRVVSHSPSQPPATPNE